MTEAERAKEIAEKLYAAIGGPNGMNCSGSCSVDGMCVCSPAYQAIDFLRAYSASVSTDVGLREAVARDLHRLRDTPYLAVADAVLSAIHASGWRIVPAEPTVAKEEAK